MFDFGALCPHCDEKFELSMIGLGAKEFIQCPHCRKIFKLDLADTEKGAIRIVPDLVNQFLASKR
jgi:Zn-finger nucleic acid-binding protein